jgi:hypothetical protein
VGALFFLIDERTQVSAAALADSSCYASLTEAERGLFMPRYVGGNLWRVRKLA